MSAWTVTTLVFFCMMFVVRFLFVHMHESKHGGYFNGGFTPQLLEGRDALGRVRHAADRRSQAAE